jgi:hypothetical protein
MQRLERAFGVGHARRYGALARAAEVEALARHGGHHPRAAQRQVAPRAGRADGQPARAVLIAAERAHHHRLSGEAAAAQGGARQRARRGGIAAG